MRTYLVSILLLISTSVLSENLAELNIKNLRYKNEGTGIEYTIRNLFQDLNNVVITLDLNVMASTNLVTNAQCEFAINVKPVEGYSYAVYNDGSIQFYFEKIEALALINFTLVWQDVDMLPESASIRLESDNGILSTNWHRYEYYHFVDPVHLQIYIDSLHECRLG